MTAARCARAIGAAAALLAGALLAGCGGAPPRPDSVVLVVVDTLRADALGLYGAARPTSPELDAWAAGGAVFEHAYTVSPWTLTSFGSLLTGELPSTHRAGTFERATDGSAPHRKAFRRLDPELPALAERLAAAGLATGAIINNAFLDPKFGLDRGFEIYDFHPGNKQRIRRADAAVDRALEWIGGRGERPFFLLLHLMDPHITYDPPPETRGRFASSVPETGAPRETSLDAVRGLLRAGRRPDADYLRALYDEEVAFVDAQLGRLTAALEERGLAGRTLVAVTSDHGEEFFDHDGFEHGHSMYGELLHVPLAVRGPGVEPGRIAAPVSLLDLYPTVLDALGVELPAGLPGRSLWPALAGEKLEPRPLLAEVPLYGPVRGAIVRWPLKLIRTVRRNGRERLEMYDLSEDPAERRDLARADRERAGRLAKMLTAALAAAEGENRGEAAELDAETLEALRSLGYID